MPFAALIKSFSHQNTDFKTKFYRDTLFLYASILLFATHYLKHNIVYTNHSFSASTDRADRAETSHRGF